jgi:hypothetical protein
MTSNIRWSEVKVCYVLPQNRIECVIMLAEFMVSFKLSTDIHAIWESENFKGHQPTKYLSGSRIYLSKDFTHS